MPREDALKLPCFPTDGFQRVSSDTLANASTPVAASGPGASHSVSVGVTLWGPLIPSSPVPVPPFPEAQRLVAVLGVRVISRRVVLVPRASRPISSRDRVRAPLWCSVRTVVELRGCRLRPARLLRWPFRDRPVLLPVRCLPGQGMGSTVRQR